MTLRVPLGKAKVSGLRRLSSRKEMDAALAKLRGRSRAKRTMWSRRAQEYQAKIASGDPGFHRRGGSRPLPQRGPAGAILQRAADLSGGSRPVGARVCRRRADRRDHRNPAGRATADRLSASRAMRSAPERGAGRIEAGRKFCPVAGRPAGLGDRRRSMARRGASSACTTRSASGSSEATGSSISAIMSAMAARSLATIDELLDFRRRVLGRPGGVCLRCRLSARRARRDVAKAAAAAVCAQSGRAPALDGPSGHGGDNSGLWRRPAARVRGVPRRRRARSPDGRAPCAAR